MNTSRPRRHILGRWVEYSGQAARLLISIATPSPRHSVTTVRKHRIAELAGQVGLPEATVGYYGEVGLITREPRSDGGYRLYTEENTERLELIMQLQPLGFGGEELRGLLAARDTLGSPGASAADRQQAGERLIEFARLTDERCAKLGGQLAAARALAERLARDGRDQEWTGP